MPELFHHFLAYQDRLRVTIPVDRITRSGSFPYRVEATEAFALPPLLPSLLLDDPQQHVPYTEECAPVAAIVYRFGGRIIYRQAAAGEVEARMELPPLWR